MEVFEKSQTIDPEVRAYVYSLVSAIGGSSAADDGRYVLGDDALACLKDLRRWLKLYDTKLDRFDVKRVLSEANLVKGDLLEILGQWREGDESNVLRRKVAVGSLELLTELTWPLTLDGDKATVNHVRHAPVIQLAQVEYKRAILHHESEAILYKVIAAAVPAMSTPRKERSPREEGIINLMLFLFRNVVMISQPSNLPSNGNEEDISRAETIHALDQQNVLQLILTICSGMGEDFDGQDVVIMELLFHLLKGINPDQIFQNDKEVVNDKVAEFKKALRAEKAMLSAQARTAPTRHNRFGTMIWVKQADDKLSTLTGQDTIINGDATLRKMDSTKQWNRPKHTKRDAQEGSSDFAPVHLDTRARTALKTFISDFLDSSFNPLFLHLRRALERETERIKPDHARQFFFLISWFLRAFASRQTHCPAPLEAAETPFAYIASVLTQETFVLLNRTMQKNLDDKSYADVHTCLLAFTQIMQTVSTMSESAHEDDQDIAENMQARLFYEEQTHDRILAVLRGYEEGRQGFPYLDACTELAHVFIRLLERYSKVNVDMFVKSKRRARRKAKEKPKGTATIEGLEEGEQVGDEAVNDEVEAHREVQERKFDFSRFAAKFVNEGSVNTFLSLLSRYRDLDEDHLKRCHRFFYRVAFKMERVILLYRVDILELFNRLIKGPNGLDSKMDKKSGVFREWEELVKQVFRRCIKKVQERPELIVEMLFTKIPNTLYYLEHGYDKEVIKSAPRAPAELEVKPGMDHMQEIGVAVGALINQGKLDALVWIKSVLSKAVEERQSWEDLNTALADNAKDTAAGQQLFGDGDTGENPQAPNDDTAEEQKADQAIVEATPQAPSIIVMPDNEERRIATFKDKHLRLLLKTLAFQRLGSSDDPDADWSIPSSLTSAMLEDDLDAIRKFEFDPPVYDNGQSPESFIRSAAAGRRNGYEKEASEDDGDSDLDENLFVPGGPSRRPNDPRPEKPKRKKLRRKGEEITEEERLERVDARKKREKEKDAKIKSALFVTESDDEEDEERDAEFFKKERERRGKAADAVKAALMDGRTGHGEERSSKKRKNEAKSKPVKKLKTAVFEEDSDEEEVAVQGDTEPLVISSRESSPASDEEDTSESESNAEGSDEETPLSSQTGHQDGDVAMEDAPPTKSSGVLQVTTGNEQRPMQDSDVEDDVVPLKTTRRSNRPILVVEDDSD
ncbi:Phosphatidylinositol 3-kinase tor2 [Sphaceloma murrayae]|uniref:Topoisomerase 1-associated factor 1 n=1 Tax=Sphaceloma murrayae TaxID=2082308 RepID=A0A2K1QQA8_9PEZI|nr:Phosphatidylinositol 3-kinase tor2 [Sphaceloma murrayae]